MLPLVAGPAVGADLTWTCGVVTAPVDALPWQATRTGLGAVEAGTDALDALLARVDDDCVADCAYPEVDCPARSCTSAAGDIVTWEATYASYDSSSLDSSAETLTVRVEPPTTAGLGWDWAEVQVYTYGNASSDISWSEDTTWTVSWGGSLDPAWPVDGAFVATEISGSERSGEGWDDGTCSWETTAGGSWVVTVDGVRVEVLGLGNALSCNGLWDYEIGGGLATLDGDTYTFVDWETWEPLAGTDADGDGWTVAAGDCDDTDAGAYCWAEELPEDGVDQDCDGADDVAEVGPDDTAATDTAATDTATDIADTADTAADTTTDSGAATDTAPPPAAFERDRPAEAVDASPTGCASLAAPDAAGALGVAMAALLLLRRRRGDDGPGSRGRSSVPPAARVSGAGGGTR
ncbi:MAG: hypothetical protein Q8P41_07680 [Pseudomonadota bacterium]|nr:hypothetical protein [Pseudomonadota bacterium]